MKTEKFVTVTLPADASNSEWYTLYTCPNTSGSQAIIIWVSAFFAGSIGGVNIALKNRNNGVDKYELGVSNTTPDELNMRFKNLSFDAGDELLVKSNNTIRITLLEIENVT